MSTLQAEKRLQLGDWVEITGVNSKLDGTIGYISDERDEDDWWFFQGVRNPKSSFHVVSGWIQESSLRAMPSDLTKRDVNDLIDLALDQRDEETFTRLLDMKTNRG